MQYSSRPRGSIVVRRPVTMRDQLKEIAEREGEMISTNRAGDTAAAICEDT